LVVVVVVLPLRNKYNNNKHRNSKPPNRVEDQENG
jgi:hypothetical protein